MSEAHLLLAQTSEPELYAVILKAFADHDAGLLSSFAAADRIAAHVSEILDHSQDAAAERWAELDRGAHGTPAVVHWRRDQRTGACGARVYRLGGASTQPALVTCSLPGCAGRTSSRLLAALLAEVRAVLERAGGSGS